MEQKLKRLFDYQKFQNNPRLEAMLAEAEGSCAALEDDALDMVSAAGDGQLMLHPDSLAYELPLVPLPPEKRL